MCMYFQAGEIKYLLTLIFLSFIIAPALPNSHQVTDTIKVQKKDTAKVQVKDTSKIQGKDTAKVQVNDTTKVQKKDTANLQVKDTLKHQLPDSIIYKQTTFSAEELMRGERLFYGLVYLEKKSVNCVGCHNTSVSDTLNWNPDALEISRKVEQRGLRK